MLKVAQRMLRRKAKCSTEIVYRSVSLENYLSRRNDCRNAGVDVGMEKV